MIIYFDNAATTKIDDIVLNDMNEFSKEYYANPSAIHKFGYLVEEKVKEATKGFADTIGVDPKEIIWTSSGTESNNLAIRGYLNAHRKVGNKIITTKIEHPSVINVCENLIKDGFEVEYLSVDSNGQIDLNELSDKIDDKTLLVSIMHVNNEIGAVQDIQKIGTLIKDKNKNVAFHVDAVQGYGKYKINCKKMHIDLLSISAHKFHGPKGVGVLYCRKSVPLFSLIKGGSQERNRRAGTENLAGIVGMSIALEEAANEMEQVSKKEKKLRDKLFAELSKIPHSKINGDVENRLPNNFNMSFEGIEGESLILLLNDKGICASSGSACTSGSLDPSHVLLSIGLPHEIAHGSLRLTLSKYTTEEEIDKTIIAVKDVVGYLRKMSPVWDKLEKGEIKHAI